MIIILYTKIRKVRRSCHSRGYTKIKSQLLILTSEILASTILNEFN